MFKVKVGSLFLTYFNTLSYVLVIQSGPQKLVPVEFKNKRYKCYNYPREVVTHNDMLMTQRYY